MKIIFVSIFISKDSVISKKTNNQQFDQLTNVDSKNSEKILQTIN